MKKIVYVAMSGGVDSSLAAYLLNENGSQVIGVTLLLWDGQKKEIIDDAKEVANRIGIEHRVLDVRKEFQEKVIAEFCREYSAGRTPNPCVKCNAEIKFGILLDWVISQGGSNLATGHYARICNDEDARIFSLLKARDTHKDQSYMLWRLTQRQLSYLLFPLGEYTKKEIKKIALEKRVIKEEKPESQEICFIPDNDYRSFLKDQSIHEFDKGEICLADGTVIGLHQGIGSYTIGQRKNLGLAAGYPLYVMKIERENKRIIVGKREEVFRDSMTICQTNFIQKQPEDTEINVEARIRYNMKEASAVLSKADGDCYQLKFQIPQWAVTPGQSAVFYQGNKLIGGGIIADELD